MASFSSSGSAVGSSDGYQKAGDRRDSTGSGISLSRSSSEKQLSLIEKSVTHLLVATKQLLETLTQWSRQQATESEVSDVYVRLGYEFNLACRAFGAIGMDTADLGPVPDLLRSILEETLSQDASRDSLNQYLPRIRDIVINLLHGLKKKQAKLRSRQGKRGKSSPQVQGSPQSTDTGDPQRYNNNNNNQSPVASSFDSSMAQKRAMSQRPDVSAIEEPVQSPTRKASPPWSHNQQGGSFAEREEMMKKDQPLASPLSRLDAATAQYASSTLPHSTLDSSSTLHTDSTSPSTHNFAYPPPAEPYHQRQADAINLLQRSGELERRASRRFSAYQIQKHLGASPNGVPVLPSSQTAPMPNRGQDVSDSMNAVRLRGAHSTNRRLSRSRFGEAMAGKSRGEPATQNRKTSTVFEEPPALAESLGAGSFMKPPTEKPRSPGGFESRDGPGVGNVHELEERGALQGSEGIRNDRLEVSSEPKFLAPGNEVLKPGSITSSSYSQAEVQSERSTPPLKEITLFLQYKSRVKKFILPEGASDLTIARLQLAFIEKFAWHTQSNGADLPEIYIQDPVSGIRHELEDLSDVKDRSVLVLNIEALDEVKKHFDESVGGIRQAVESVRGVVDGQGASIQKLIDRQQEAAKEISRLASASPPLISGAKSSSTSIPFALRSSDGGVAEINSLRTDLQQLRQTYSTFVSDISDSMKSVKSKAGEVKAAAADAAIPSFEGDAGRARVMSGKKELAQESEQIVSKVDDLQDLVEDLRKDVVTRGVRPLPRQLEAVGRDISLVTKDLKKMQEFLKREKPIWTKIWEKELQLVCEERDQLTMQEDLAVDLEDDLEKATQTFALVEQATKQQNAETPEESNGIGSRNVSKNFQLNQITDPAAAKDSLLGEVRALQPNHENRVLAIERAERQRVKDLESRGDDKFQRELRRFVSDDKLRKNGGGIEELERMREEKEKLIRKEVWGRILGTTDAPDGGEGSTQLADAPSEPVNELAATVDESGATRNNTDSNIEADGLQAGLVST